MPSLYAPTCDKTFGLRPCHPPRPQPLWHGLRPCHSTGPQPLWHGLRPCHSTGPKVSPNLQRREVVARARRPAVKPGGTVGDRATTRAVTPGGTVGEVGDRATTRVAHGTLRQNVRSRANIPPS